jgi:chromosome partitioning protein
MTAGPHVLMVCNRKGGTGKTTTAVNLAAEFAARGRRTLLVDLDTQGHAALGVGLAPLGKGALTVHGLFQDPALRLTQVIRPTPHAGLWVAPADLLFDGIGVADDRRRLARELAAPEISGAFDVVVLDTPPSLDIASMNGMAAANDVLIPVFPHALGLEGVQQLVRLIFRFASGDNPGLRLIGLLPVMLDPRINLHRSVMAELARQFGAERILSPIRCDIRLAEAFHARQPVRTYAPRSRGALDFHMLADELVLPELATA